MNTGKCTTFTQCIERLGKHSTIQNSAHRKLLLVFFNSSSGISVTEAVNVQCISILSIYEDVQLHTNSHASDSGVVWREGRIILDDKSKLLYSEIALPRKPFGIGHMYMYTFLLRMTDIMTSQNIDLFSWHILYISLEES
jgi:hypothetical protein